MMICVHQLENFSFQFALTFRPSKKFILKFAPTDPVSSFENAVPVRKISRLTKRADEICLLTFYNILYSFKDTIDRDIVYLRKGGRCISKQCHTVDVQGAVIL